MGQLGQFIMDKSGIRTFEVSDKSLQKHLLEAKTNSNAFRVYRIIKDNDSDYKIVKDLCNPVEFKYKIEEFDGYPVEFLTYEPRPMKHPRIRTFKDTYLELDIIDKIIIPSKRIIGRSFGQDAIQPFYYIGTEETFIYELDYEVEYLIYRYDIIKRHIS
ncbi:MAG: hypothetical protein K0B02_01800 [DPANN group archaeon]|nr:hypothetical protein [DPANN group archaeon]